MEKVRKPFQGVLNIIRFNWHFYVVSLSFVLGLFLISNYVEHSLTNVIFAFCLIILIMIILSLVVSFYVYDLSGFYSLKWIDQNNDEKRIVNINAGFDETSHLIQRKFKNVELLVLDFYNPETHTEVSIQRARKIYPPFPKTKQINTSSTEIENNSVDKIFVILAAHEIRNTNERTAFFLELKRIIKPEGQIYVTEHLRDFSNFLAYNIGFLHFHSRTSWIKNFNDAQLTLQQEKKLTPFISAFTLNKNGNIH